MLTEFATQLGNRIAAFFRNHALRGLIEATEIGTGRRDVPGDLPPDLLTAVREAPLLTLNGHGGDAETAEPSAVKRGKGK